jgi:hypothetical protein
VLVGDEPEMTAYGFNNAIKTNLQEASAPASQILDASLSSSPSQSSAVNFLSDALPHHRRIILAAHSVYVEQSKFELFMKNYEEEERIQTELVASQSATKDFLFEEWRKRVNAANSVTTSSEKICNHRSQSSKKRPRRLMSTSSDANRQASQERQAEEISIKHQKFQTGYSSLYEKLFLHFQTFYNEQDLMSLTTLLLFPCFTPQFTRSKSLWSGCFSPLKTSRDPPSGLSSPTVVKKMSNTVIREFSGKSYEQVFENLPDCMIVYHRGIHMKVDHAYAPNYLTFTVPSLMIPRIVSTSNGTDFQELYETVINIRVNVEGSTVTVFNEQGIATKVEDHFYRVEIGHPLVNVEHILSYYEKLGNPV